MIDLGITISGCVVACIIVNIINFYFEKCIIKKVTDNNTELSDLDPYKIVYNYFIYLFSLKWQKYRKISVSSLDISKNDRANNSSKFKTTNLSKKKLKILDKKITEEVENYNLKLGDIK